jgi:hypothetical protein
MWRRLGSSFCCCCCCGGGGSANRVHPYAPAMGSVHASQAPSVIDLGPGPGHCRVLEDASESQSLDFSHRATCGDTEFQICESTVAQASGGERSRSPSPPVNCEPVPAFANETPRAAVTHESILQSINRAGLDHAQHSALRSRVLSPSSTVPERVQKGLRRSSMYQDPTHSLHFVVLSTEQFAIRVELDKISRAQFDALLSLIQDPTDEAAIREACHLCHRLGHAWSSLPRRMEISAGLLHVPIQDLEQRMRDSRNASLMLNRPAPDSPV